MIKELNLYTEIIKITASNPLDKSCQTARVALRPVFLRGERYFQAESFRGTQVFHCNVPAEDSEKWFEENVEGVYKQIHVVLTNKEITYLTSTNGKTTRIERAMVAEKVCNNANNRRKNYILNEGDNVPAMIELGIFTKDGKVVAGMYDKFKQINRFVEILDDVLKDRTGTLTLLDFGCGKSYLTFIIYHYLTEIRHLDVNIIGYDLKSDVVAHCNELAAKYGYTHLRFEVADVSQDKLYDEHIDVVVSLHARDTATDYALHFAVTHNVPYIFSVPCCQHEVNNSITKGGDLDVLLKYGIIKERVSALLTDSIRAMLLEDAGYKVDVMEFVDLAHSPKNIMLRCVKRGKPNSRNAASIRYLAEKYHFEQTLYRLLNADDPNQKQ